MATKKKTTGNPAQDRRIRDLSHNPLVSPYVGSLTGLANGDKNVLSSLLGGAQLGGQFFAPGSLGRLDENVMSDPNVAKALSLSQNLVDTPADSSGLQSALTGTQNAASSADINSGVNQDVLSQIRQTLGNSSNQTDALDIAHQNALTAGNLSPLEQELLNVRRGGMAGMDLRTLTAAREGGVTNADGSVTPGESAINRAAKSALLSLGGSNLVNRRGISSGSLPVIQSAQTAQGDLERKLILDEYGSKLTGQTNFVNAAQGVQTNVDSRVNNTAQTYGSLSNNAQSIAGTNAGIYGSTVNGMNRNMVDANSNVAGAANNLATFKENSLQSRLDRFTNTVGNIRNEILFRKTYNLNAMSTEKSGVLSSILGAGAFGAQQEGTKDSNKIALAGIDAAKSFGASNPWGSSSKSNKSSNSSSSGNSNTDSFDTNQ